MRRLMFAIVTLGALSCPNESRAQKPAAVGSLLTFEGNGIKNSVKNQVFDSIVRFDFTTNQINKEATDGIKVQGIATDANSLKITVTGSAVEKEVADLRIKGIIGDPIKVQEGMDADNVLRHSWKDEDIWWEYNMALDIEKQKWDGESFSDVVVVRQIEVRHRAGNDGQILGPDTYIIRAHNVTRGDKLNVIDKHRFDVGLDGNDTDTAPHDHDLLQCACDHIEVKLAGRSEKNPDAWYETYGFKEWQLVINVNHTLDQPAPAPEPATWLLGLTGLAAVIGTQVWKKRYPKSAV